MNDIDIAINKWIDNHTIDELNSNNFYWINDAVKGDIISFWRNEGIIDSNNIRTTKITNDKLIFLDCDGVINHSKSNSYVDYECMNNLKMIVDETNAHIILISSWKNDYDNKPPFRSEECIELDDKLNKLGLSITHLASKHIYKCILTVVDFIMKYNTSNYVILDDELFYYLDNDNIRKHLVFTNYYEGALTIEKALEAVRIFNI